MKVALVLFDFMCLTHIRNAIVLKTCANLKETWNLRQKRNGYKFQIKTNAEKVFWKC